MSLDMRTRAMRCRALLAARSPPRESRCRLVLPEDAGMGCAGGGGWCRR